MMIYEVYVFLKDICSLPPLPPLCPTKHIVDLWKNEFLSDIFFLALCRQVSNVITDCLQSVLGSQLTLLHSYRYI